MCTSRVSPSTSPSPSTSTSSSTTSSSSWLWLLVTTFVTLLRLLDGFWQMGYWFLIYRTHSSRFASVPFRTLPQLFITLISCKPPNTPLCVCVCVLASFPSMRLTVAHFRIKTQKVSSFFNMLLQNLQTQLAQPASQLSQQLINKTHRLPFYPYTPFTQSPLCRVSRAGEGPSCNCISLVRRFLRVTCHTVV